MTDETTKRRLPDPFGIHPDLLRAHEERLAGKMVMPTTLDDLDELLGAAAEAAKEKATWDAIIGWLMRGPEAERDQRSTRMTVEAASLYCEHVLGKMGLPRSDGRPRLPEFDTFYRSRRARIKRKALEIRAVWEQLGRPRLSEALPWAYTYVRAAVAAGAPTTPAEK